MFLTSPNPKLQTTVVLVNLEFRSSHPVSYKIMILFSVGYLYFCCIYFTWKGLESRNIEYLMQIIVLVCLGLGLGMGVGVGKGEFQNPSDKIKIIKNVLLSEISKFYRVVFNLLFKISFIHSKTIDNTLTSFGTSKLF